VRVGTGLQLNGSPFQLVGLNIWQATVNTWNAPLNGHVAVNAGTTLQTWLADIRATAPHVNVIRTWFFQQFAINGGTRDWSAFDKVLSVCDAAGFKVIACLEDNWAYERQGSHSPALSSSWFNGGYKTTVLPKETETYRDWVAEVVAHYSADPRIAVWELCNEPNAITQGFVSDVSGLIKSLDAQTPVSCGEVGPLSSSIYALPGVDLASYHYYTVYNQTNWQAVQRAAAAVGKPWYVGECGFSPSSSRPKEFQSLISDAFSTANCAGFVAWQFANQGGDSFNIGTGDAALPVLNSFA
jgi:endo-1,4-beta-mannosidase